MGRKPPAPVGYESWLDYAVENFDTRALVVARMFDNDSSHVDRAAIREAARKELMELRARAQLSDSKT